MMTITDLAMRRGTLELHPFYFYTRLLPTRASRLSIRCSSHLVELSSSMLGCICSVELACGSTLASKLSIFRSKAVSWFSIAAAVFSPLSKRICVSLFGSECGREPSVSVIGYWLLVVRREIRGVRWYA